MQLITIQNKAVLQQLLDNKVYTADFSRVSDNLVKPYQYMQKTYGWTTCPVFCIKVGSDYGGFGFNSNNAAVLELDVPDDLVKLQYFYDWSDVIYFMEFPDEFETTFDTNIVPTVEDWADRVLRFEDQGSYRVYQATIPCIHPQWLTRYLADEDKVSAFINKLETDCTVVSLESFAPVVENESASRTSIFI